MESEPYTNEYGTTTWYNRAGQRHREDGPAVEYDDGSEEWYINGVLHRDGGPGVYAADGFTAWYRHGQLHREDGPARQWAFESEDEWWRHGQRIEAAAIAKAPGRVGPIPEPRTVSGFTAAIERDSAREVVDRARRAQVAAGRSTTSNVKTPAPRHDTSVSMARRIDWER